MDSLVLVLSLSPELVHVVRLAGQQSSCLCLSSTEITGAPWPGYAQILNIELGSPCLQGNHFTNWTILPGFWFLLDSIIISTSEKFHGNTKCEYLCQVHAPSWDSTWEHYMCSSHSWEFLSKLIRHMVRLLLTSAEHFKHIPWSL